MTYDELKQKIKLEIPCTEFLEPSPDGAKGKYICPFCKSGTKHGDKSSGGLIYNDNDNTVHCYSCGEHHDVIDVMKQVLNADYKTVLKRGQIMLGITENVSESRSQIHNQAKKENRNTSIFISRLEKVIEGKTLKEKEKIRTEFKNQETTGEKESYLVLLENSVEEENLKIFLNDILPKDTKPETRMAYKGLFDNGYSVDNIEQLRKNFKAEFEKSDFESYLAERSHRLESVKQYDRLRTGLSEHDYTDKELNEGYRDNIDNLLVIRRGIHVLSAQSSMGKSTLMLNLADNIARQKYPVLYITTEMTQAELIDKSLNRIASTMNAKNKIQAITSPLTVAKIARGNFTDDEKKVFTKAVEAYKETIAPYIRIVQVKDRSINHIQAVIEFYISRFRYEAGNENLTPIIFIDYLQLLHGDLVKDKRLEIDSILESFEKIRDKYNACIYVLSSVSRSSYGQPLTVGAAKESGEIDFTAESLMTLDFTKQCKSDKTKNNSPIDITAKRNNTKNNNNTIESDEKLWTDNPRKISLRFFKNRNFIARGAIELEYYAAADYFTAKQATLQKPQSILKTVYTTKDK